MKAARPKPIHQTPIFQKYWIAFLQFFQAKDFQLWFSVFVFFGSLFALTNSGYSYSEGNYHYQVAEHILKTGQLGFDTPQEGIFTTAPNGRTYASHEFGSILFYIPTALINLWVASIASSFVSSQLLSTIEEFIRSFQASWYLAATLTAFFAITRFRFHQSIVNSFIATLCLGLTTYVWTYTREYYDGVLCSTLLILSFLFLLTFKERQNWQYLVGAFIFLGLGFITRLSMVLPIAVSFGYLVLISRRGLIKSVAIALLTLAPFFVWQSWYNHLRTGIFYLSPVQADPKYTFANGLDGNLITGLTGVFLSPGKSIFVYAPLLILAVLLLPRFCKTYKKEAFYLIFLTIAWFLLHAKLRSWYGSWGWGPRHYLTILPLLFLPLATQIEHVFKTATLKFSAIFLSVAGFVLALSSIISSPYWRMVNARDSGTIADEVFVWGFRHSQPVDMIESAIRNVVNSYRIVVNSPVIRDQNLWYLDAGVREYGSFTINVWCNSLIFAGIPWYVVLFLVLVLLSLMYFSVRTILGISRSSLERVRTGL